MENFFKVCGAIMMVLFCAVLGTALFHSCTDRESDREYYEDLIEDKVQEVLPDAMMQMYTFTSATDAMLYQQERATQKSTEDVFLSMTEKEVADVSTVLLKKLESITISDIVNEYRANRRIYSNLPPDPLQIDEPQKDRPQEPADPPVATDSGKQIVVPLKNSQQ